MFWSFWVLGGPTILKEIEANKRVWGPHPFWRRYIARDESHEVPWILYISIIFLFYIKILIFMVMFISLDMCHNSLEITV